MAVVNLMLLASCSTSADLEAVAATTAPTRAPASTAEVAPVPVVAVTSSPTVNASNETTIPMETPTVPPTVEPDPKSACVTIADFSTAEANAEWAVVNDNVMGGRSLGNLAFADGAMTFSGSINTDGGGFASLRLALPQEIPSTAEHIAVTARSDGRNYLLTFDDSLDGRNRRVSFRGPLEFATPGEWETVSVPLAGLYAASFGQPVSADPFRPDLATRIGIMLSDGVDGEFALEIDHIEACS